MACTCNLNTAFSPSFNLNRNRRPKSVVPISCSIVKNRPENLQDEESRFKDWRLNILKVSATLTVISSLLPKPSSAAVKVSEKKRTRKTAEALTPEELKRWTEGIPLVSDRIPYSELLDLKRENKLQYVIKSSTASLKERPEVVLAVLNDNKVVRVVLPSVENDSNFWEEWDKLDINGLCMNAYSPPLKKPEMPSPYLGILTRVPLWVFSKMKPKPPSKKELELRKLREEIKRKRKEELTRMKNEREMMDREMRREIRMEEKERKMEMRKQRYEESLLQAQASSQGMAVMWSRLANDSNVSTALGFVFFYIFYRVVVLNYRKQMKDYDDRLKIEKADAEEKKKIRELEKEMEGIEFAEDSEEGTEGNEDAYAKVAKQFMRSGARVRKAQRKRIPQYLEMDVDVKFSDVAGLGKIRDELEEIVKFFTHSETYRRRGVKIPGGILLCGPPGVGKTLLAKAVAGEAGVNFFSISASQFVEIYVGVGASRVRALYQEAKDNAPSVVFIDELDAVGRERGIIKGSGGQERDATLNQLLVCLDGFEGRGEVITIASTNRPDILDPALVRPGRFDRKIFIPKPGMIGRIEILQVHARNKPMAPDIDYKAVASMTDGMVGAELANIIEVAAINMMRDGRTEITTDDLLQAAQIEERGSLDRKVRSPETWKQVALNEAAMAVVAVNFPDLKNIEFLTISPRAGRELGYVRMKMDYMKFKEGLLSRQSLLDHITVQLAPRAADELWYGKYQLSTIWAETADNARSAARTLILCGLSDKHYGMNNFWTRDRINDIDTEALRILESCYERAKVILEQNRELVNVLVENLVEKKSLTKLEFFRFVNQHGCLQPPPPSLVDIRSANLLELNEAALQ